jgi:regulator of nucleoside diphosphate kinase
MNRKTILGDPPPIYITDQDLDRLDVLLASMSGKRTGSLEFLRDELDRAQLVDGERAVEPFVRIGSRVLFRDERGNTYRLTLAFPERTSSGASQISVLTPVGAALLGLSEGQAISYETPDNRVKTITVLHVSPNETSKRPSLVGVR